ncbi:MAG: hypothetical protein H8F28_05570 [Fibrella sp.]|nr:hypothetical protein [Armatimonadota bacterium]
MSSLSFTSDLNDSNTLAFRYTLADGKRSIAVAQINAPVVVPEAGTRSFGELLTSVGALAKHRE